MRIHFHLAGCFEAFSPRTAARTGIGGSELMAIDLSTAMAKAGHDVIVWAECFEGVYDGVEWRNWARPLESCDLFIASRQPGKVNYHAKRNVLWCHDTQYGGARDGGEMSDVERSMMVHDSIVGLSNWHVGLLSKCYPSVSDKITVIRNGVPVSYLESSTPYEKYRTDGGTRVAYASSPDRGLKRTIEAVKLAREALPAADFRLDVYYGFKSLSARAKSFGDTQLQAEIAELLDLMVLYQHEGWLTSHGRLSRKDLFGRLSRTHFWLYPTQWTETSCVIAMEALLAGCYPIFSPVAALPETVGLNGRCMRVNASTADYAGMLCEMTLRGGSNVGRVLEERVGWARQHCEINSRVKQWEALVP